MAYTIEYKVKHSGYALKPGIASTWVDEDYIRHGFEKSGWFWVMPLDSKFCEGQKNNIYFYLAITPQHDIIFWLSNDGISFLPDENEMISVDDAHASCEVDNVYDLPKQFIDFLAGGFIYAKQ